MRTFFDQFTKFKEEKDDLELAISDILSCMPDLTSLLVMTLYTENKIC